MKNKVVFIGVHPDDETLGCGGTILRHKNSGDEIYWLIITNVSEKAGFDERLVRQRQNEIDEVSLKYNFNNTFKLNFPTTGLDNVPIGTIIQKISEIFIKIRPTIVYLPFSGDIHTDHQIAFNAVYSCTKSFRYPSITKILMFETLSETEFAPAISGKIFTPNVFIDISMHIDKKLKIFQVFKSEVMGDNYPRSLNAIKSLAAFRGSRIGCDFAEAFQLIFEKK